MTALPTDPWRPGTGRTAPDRETDVCLSCGVVFAWRDGWDGDCLDCAVLTQEHLAGGHDTVAVAACRRCT